MGKTTKANDPFDDPNIDGHRHFLKDAIFELGYGDDIPTRRCDHRAKGY